MSKLRKNSERRLAIETTPNLSKVHKWLLREPGESEMYQMDEDDWNKNDLEDESGNVNHTSLLHFLEPEVVDDEFDIKIGKTYYRVFINKTLEKVWCNEIVSFDYNGIVLLKNPINRDASKQLTEFFLERNLPKNERADTWNDAKRKWDKFYHDSLKRQSSKKQQGNQRKNYIPKAIWWCVKNHFPKSAPMKPTIERAYKKFSEDPRLDFDKRRCSEKSFVEIIRREWVKLITKYSNQTVEFKDHNSRLDFYKSELNALITDRKQRIK